MQPCARHGVAVPAEDWGQGARGECESNLRYQSGNPPRHNHHNSRPCADAYRRRYRQPAINNPIGHAARAPLNSVCNGSVNRIARDCAYAAKGKLRLLRRSDADIDQCPERSCAEHIAPVIVDLALYPSRP